MTLRSMLLAVGAAAVVGLAPTMGRADAAHLTEAEADTAVSKVESALAHYTFPETGAKVIRAVEDHRIALAKTSDPTAFAKTLTELMQAVGHDKHFAVFQKEVLPREAETPETDRQEELASAARAHGFCDVRRLPGNVGYIDLAFMAASPNVEHTIDAALGVLADTDALIIDLRTNTGGGMATADFFAGRLTGKPDPLVNVYFPKRDGSFQMLERRASPRSDGRAYDKPVFVVVSAKTISAAEEFAYDLKVLKRAIIVGATTVGAANPGELFPIGPNLAVFVPTGRVESPITHSNWEGTGVVPDVAAAADEVLRKAYTLALSAAKPQVHTDGLDRERAKAIADPKAALRRSFGRESALAGC